ncbi:hypothetical protein Tco_0180161 [Tanacetum coccineum]
MPPTPDLSFFGLDEFFNKAVVEKCKAMYSEEEPKVVRNNYDAPCIKERVSDDEEEDVSQPKTEKKTVRPSIVENEFVKSKQQQKTARKTVKQMEDMLLLERTPKEVKSQMGKGSVNLTDPHHTPTFIQPQKTQKPRNPRKDTQVPQSSDPMENVADETVQKELGDSLVRATTTSSSLEAEQDSGDITKTRSKATPNQSSSLETTSGGGPRCQETMGDTIARTRFESVSNILEIHARKRVLDLEKGQTTSLNNEIVSLKRRVKKLEKKNRSRTHKLKKLYKVGLTARVESSGDEESLGKDASKQGRRINAIDADEEITIVSGQDDADKDMFNVDALNGEEAKIDVDYQLAERLQAQEQEELSIEEKATSFQQLLEKRRSILPIYKSREIRNKNHQQKRNREDNVS